MDSYDSSPSELGCPVNSRGECEEVELRFMSPESDEADFTPKEFSLIESRYEHASSSSSSGSQQDSHARDLRHKGLSIEYQPKVFDDIVGHDVIIRALSNAIRWKRVSSLYLFHGPGGTGKTSAARIFAMALNCEFSKPCWGCTGCSRSQYTTELCFDNIRTFLQSNTQGESSSRVSVFIIENKLSPDVESWLWGELLNLAQELEDKRFGSVVFILITKDASRVPRAVSSRCQKFNFSKLRDTDVLLKLSRIVAQEAIEIRKNALQLIAREADGNLREAENLLDQLALLDLKIDTSMIQQLVGIVPRNRLVRLLEAALTGSSTEAVKCTRDLISFGIEPQQLVPQLVSLVTELLADGCSSSSATLKDQRSIKGGSLLRNKLPERLCRALEILIKTEKQLMKLPCNHTTWVTAAVLQIASDGFSYHIPIDENSDSPGRLDSEDMNSITHVDETESRKTRQHQFTNSIAQHLSKSIVNPDADIKGVDLDELWHNILKRIQNKSLRNFLQCQAELISLTASRANAIVHLMLKHSEEIPDESIETTLKEALGCPVTLNISRRLVHQEIVTGNCFTQIPRPTKEAVASMDGRGLLMKPRVSQESVHTVESNMRSTKFQDVQMFTEGTGHGVSITQNDPNRFLSEHSTQVGRDSTNKDPKMDPSGRDQSFHTTSMAKATDLKLRLLSISSIPLTDASIEPYSQDLLFEEANPDRKQGGRYSKFYKDLQRPKQHGHSIYYINRGLDRSQSCTENFCRGENMVNEDMMGLATRSNLLKWAYSCRDSTTINSIINTGQSDLRKSFPSTRSSGM